MKSPTKRTRASAGAGAKGERRSRAAEVGQQIGRVVRQLRDSQGLTLSEAATAANISAAMLSRIETGRVTPSLETLVSLSEALGVRPATLLQDLGEESDGAQHVPEGHGLEVVRRGTRRGHTYHLLAALRGPRKTFEPFLVTLTDKSEVFPGFQHPGTELIYILNGVIRYRHGTESFVLHPGDSLSFRGDIPHGPEKLEKVPIRMLSIIVYDFPDAARGR